MGKFIIINNSKSNGCVFAIITMTIIITVIIIRVIIIIASDFASCFYRKRKYDGIRFQKKIKFS